jgi:hypothetical protein
VFVAIALSYAVPSAVSVLINNNATYTDSVYVTLQLYAENATNCSYSNDGSQYSEWLPYETTKNWNLTSGDGTKTVSYRCMDDNATVSQVASDGIIVDSLPPVLSNASPSDLAWSNTINPTIKIHATDIGSGINSSSIVMLLDNNVVNSSYENATSFVTYIASNLNVSNHSVSVSLTDNYGRSASKSWSFSIDISPPGIFSLTPINNSILGYGSPKISVFLEDNESGINSTLLVFTVAGSSVTKNAVFDPLTGDFHYLPPTNLNDGNHTVSVTAVDNSGNSHAVNWFFAVDRTAPVVTPLFPSKDSVYGNSVNNITATITDALSGVNRSSVDVRLDSHALKGESFNLGNGYLMVPLVGEQDSGPHKIEILVQDNLGNSQYFAWSFKIERKGPAIVSFSPQENAIVNNSKPQVAITFKDTGSTGLNDSSVQLFLDNVDVTASSVRTTGKITYSLQSHLSDTRHDVKFLVSNNEGYTLTKSWNFSVDTIKPDKPNALSASVTGSTVKLSWSSLPTDTLKEYLVYKAASNDFSALSLLKTLGSSESSHTIKFDGKKMYFAVSAMDAAGNEGEKAYIGTCGEFLFGTWSDYGCCNDADCISNSTCNTTTKTCTFFGNSTIAIKSNLSDAMKAINSTTQAIVEAKNKSMNTSEAEKILEQAKNALNVGNYEQAKYLAEYAMSKLVSATSLASGTPLTVKETSPAFCCPTAFIFPLLIFVACLQRPRVRERHLIYQGDRRSGHDCT